MPNSIKKLEEAFKEGKYDQLLKDIEKAPKKKGKKIYWMHTIPFWSGAVQEALAFNENAQIAGCELTLKILTAIYTIKT